MLKTVRSRTLGARIRRVAVPLLTLPLMITLAAPASATHRDRVIVLPNASSTEGIAAGRGTTYYAGDLFRGDIFRGDIRRGTAELFIDAPDGRQAVGMKVDIRHNLLFVAGGPGLTAVYNADTGATVATYQFGDAATSFINDVALTWGGAWFTDSLQAKLYFVPVDWRGVPGPFRTLQLSGPAADTTGQFNLNGIVATPDGRRLIVAHTARQELYTVNAITGASALIAGIDGTDGDGLVLDGRQIWVVQSFSEQISRYRLSGDLSSAKLEKVITSKAFAEPSTAARFGHRLAAVNSHFKSGFPPTSPTYEVVIVDA